MAQKILVTTDLSKNSKAGIRFAIQLALQERSQLIFYHVLRAPTPTTLSQDKYMAFIQDTIVLTRKRVESFVRAIYRQMNLNPKKVECVVEFKPFVAKAIISFAASRKAKFICMSTRGAAF